MIIYTVHRQGSWDTLALIYKEENGKFSFNPYKEDRFPYPINLIADTIDALFTALDKLLAGSGVYECISTDKTAKGWNNKNIGSTPNA